MSAKEPSVGVAVLIVKHGLILLGQRMGSHGDGTWAPPGGHLKFGETVEQCAAREVREETGLVIEKFRSAPYTNDFFFAEQKHYVSLFLIAVGFKGEPAVLEPDKCKRWLWFPWSTLPRSLFQPFQTLINSGFIPDNAKEPVIENIRGQIIGYSQSVAMSRLSDSSFDEADLRIESCSCCGYYFDRMDVIADSGSGYECIECATAEVDS